MCTNMQRHYFNLKENHTEMLYAVNSETVINSNILFDI